MKIATAVHRVREYALRNGHDGAFYSKSWRGTTEAMWRSAAKTNGATPLTAGQQARIDSWIADANYKVRFLTATKWSFYGWRPYLIGGRRPGNAFEEAVMAPEFLELADALGVDHWKGQRSARHPLIGYRGDEPVLIAMPRLSVVAS